MLPDTLLLPEKLSVNIDHHKANSKFDQLSVVNVRNDISFLYLDYHDSNCVRIDDDDGGGDR